MKKCPNCSNTFDDEKRFCQIDGTPLIDDAPAEDENPFKTVVVGKQDIPPDLFSGDPMKTTVMRADSKDDDILQIPEVEVFDPMKTMVVSQPIKYEGLISSPPVEEPEPVVAAPEPPKFSEPEIIPPNFGEISQNEQPPPPPIIEEQKVEPPKVEPPKFEAPKVEAPKVEPPKAGSPIANPFNEAPKFDKPIANPFAAPPISPPMNQPQTPASSKFDSTPLPNENLPFEMPKNEPPPPFETSPPPFKEPEFNAPPSPFAPTPFESNLPSSQPMQQSEWNPPPVPSQQDWQNQSQGADSQFQASAPPSGKQNNTLGMVSLILGVASFICGLGFLGSIPAVITGYMQKGKIKSNPAEYGGGGLATGGIVLGVLNIILCVLGIILYVLLLLSVIQF